MWRWILFAAAVARAMAQSDSDDLAIGKKLFESQCALCHGQNGGGGRGPSLQRQTLIKAPDDAALRRVISEGIEPEMPGAWQLNPHETAAVAKYVHSLGVVAAQPLPGDPARGAAVYRRSGCANCHIAGGSGQGFGPELTNIGARRNAAWLKQTVMRPAAGMPEGFLYLRLVTASGETRCIRVNEDSFTIQCKDANGRFLSFRKMELRTLDRLKQETPMPSYASSLSAADLDDLVAYLASLRGKP
jgi:putative heme-binding domain-containing protein